MVVLTPKSGIPKLELEATILAVRLKCIFLEDIDSVVHKIRLQTNSQITLSHIRNSFKRF